MSTGFDSGFNSGFGNSKEGILSQNVTLNQTTLEVRILPRSINQAGSFSQLTTKQLIHSRSYDDTLNLVHTADSYKVYTRIISQIINLNANVVKKAIYNKIISNTIILNSTLQRTIKYGRIIHDILIFVNPKKYLFGIYVNVNNPNGILVPKKCQVLLRSIEGNINNDILLLPCPLFDDSQALVSSLNIKKTMTGRTFSYKKLANTEKLKYTFLVDRNKSLEVKDFFKNQQSNLLELDNWKPETWYGYITNNPVELNYRERGMVEFTLEFTGMKIV